MKVKHVVSCLVSLVMFSLPIAALAEPPNPPPGAANNLETRLALLEELVVDLQEQLDAAPRVSFFASTNRKIAGYECSTGRTLSAQFDVAHNDGSAYNPVSGLFTAPADGVYHFDYSLPFLSGGEDHSCSTVFGLSVNGSYPLEGTYEYVPAGQWVMSVGHSATLKLNAGDTMELRLYNGLGSWGVVGTFTGYQVY